MSPPSRQQNTGGTRIFTLQSIAPDIEVRLSNARFLQTAEVCRFNEACTAAVDVEYLHETLRKKVSFTLFVEYDGIIEDLQCRVEGFEENGVATASLHLYFSDGYYNALADRPALTCSYFFRAAHHHGEEEIESPRLVMSQSLTTELLFVDQDSKPLANMTVTLDNNEEYVTDENGKISIPHGRDTAGVLSIMSIPFPDSQAI
jgi:hypothetical protein